jgi:hypothetical protein
MSRTNNKLFCKICFDAKKPEKEYTSHAVKNRDGDICCPILKTTECRYCHKIGHIVTHCELRAKNNALAAAKVAAPAPVLKVAAPKVAVPTNKFALLDDDSEDENETAAAAVPAPAPAPEAKKSNWLKPPKRTHTVCERPLNQIFKIVDLSYLAEERERLGIVDPALGRNYAAAVAPAKKLSVPSDDHYNRPDAPRGQDCFYASEEEKQEHRTRIANEYKLQIGKPTFASADEDW